MTPLSAQIMIRPAYGDDARAVARLAALDSAERIPEGPMLLAEVDGELRAALAVDDSMVIADPFFPTLDIVALLRAHAAAATQPRRRRRRRSFLARPSLARG